MSSANYQKQLASNDTRNYKRVADLASQHGCNVPSVATLVDSIGFQRARMVLVLANEFNISSDLAIQLSDKPSAIRSLRRHPVLMKYLDNIPNEQDVDLGKRSISVRTTNIQAGHDSHGNMKSTLRFVDAHTCVFPSQQDREDEPELALLDQQSKGESYGLYRRGAVGHLDFAIGKCDGVDSQLVLNGQSRKFFYSLQSRLRRQYKKWYEKSLDVVTNAARESGVKLLLLASIEMVQEGLEAGWGHTAPPEILNQFYDGFAKKRGFRSPESLEVVHPVTSARVSGKMWAKEL